MLRPSVACSTLKASFPLASTLGEHRLDVLMQSLFLLQCSDMLTLENLPKEGRLIPQAPRLRSISLRKYFFHFSIFPE